MVMENREFEDDPCMRRNRSRATVLAAETARSAAAPPVGGRSAKAPSGAAPAAGEKISLFWQVFGGTIVSVVALIVITAFSQLTSTATDLRRDVNRVQVDLVRKDELNVRLNALWQGVKELQGKTASRASLEESVRVLNNDLGARINTDNDQRKDLQRQLEELSRRVQALAERLVSIEVTHRLTDGSGVPGKLNPD